MENKRVRIIAEAGINHNGSLDLARKMIDAASEAGADYVKFQTLKVDHLVKRDVVTAGYQSENLGGETSQYDMLKKAELSDDDHRTLQRHCEERGIQFLSTPFNVESVHLLHSLGLGLFKTGSGDLRNAPYLRAIAQVCEGVLVSTGMATLEDIKNSLSVLSFAGLHDDPPTSLSEAREFAESEAAKSWLKEKVTLLHCVSQYPTPLEYVNLKCITTLQKAFGLPVGYSDHSTSTIIPAVAVGMGARVIEKHFTLDKNMEGPDHLASLEPEEFAEMVQHIRDIEVALGSGQKTPSGIEKETYELVGKRIVAARKINQGEELNLENLTTIRSQDGRDAIYFFDMVGKEATRDYDELEAID